MAEARRYDAIVTGAGPNGLAAAVAIARTGRSVLVVEAGDTVGGGTRSAELTLPGFVHDVCSAVHPLALASPFFRDVPLEEHGLRWVHPPLPLAHPLDDGSAVTLDRSLERTAEGLAGDGRMWRRLFGPLVRRWEDVVEDLLAPLHVPSHPLPFLRFMATAPWPLVRFAHVAFRSDRTRALFAGIGAHSMLPLDRLVTSAYAFMIGLLGHAVGWPVARGGSQAIADALASHLRSLGGEVQCGWTVERIEELPSADAYLFDVTPRQLLRIAGHRFPAKYVRRLERYRYGPGVCKVDFALDGPVPWKAEECTRAGTVHLGGTMDEIMRSEQETASGRHPDRPYLIVAQQSLFDPTRAPDGKHVLWAYGHVPAGSDVDHAPAIEAQIERFAPGFRDLIIGRSVRTAADMEAYNPNYVGGDINGGVQDIFQHFTRPVPRLNPYTTPDPSIFLCSSATPPGGGVHGMAGYHAARTVLGRMR